MGYSVAHQRDGGGGETNLLFGSFGAEGSGGGCGCVEVGRAYPSVETLLLDRTCPDRSGARIGDAGDAVSRRRKVFISLRSPVYIFPF